MTDTANHTPLVYLSEPPEGGALAETWGESISAQLTGAGCHVYRPAAAWRTAPGARLRLPHSINRHALSLSDAVVAVLPSVFTGSIEVPMEIEAGLNSGIPVVVFTGLSTAELMIERTGLTICSDLLAIAATLARVLGEAPPVDRENSFPVQYHTP